MKSLTDRVWTLKGEVKGLAKRTGIKDERQWRARRKEEFER